MNEERLEAYRKLIDQLLACSSDEEVKQILNANWGLVDAGLNQTMLEVANNLREWGDLDNSNFLMDIVEQLMGVHGNTSDAQRDFLWQAVQTIVESNGDSQVVYPFLEANLNLLDDNFAPRLQNWASENLQNLEADEARVFAKVMRDFSTIIAEFPLGSRVRNIEIAIAGYEIALSVFIPQEYPTDWSETQNNLGVAYNNRILGERTENLELAINAYKNALQVYNREVFPIDWAKTQNNLGIAYRNRILGERAENLELAIDAYKNALQVVTRQNNQKEWAGIQNNLGLAYSQRIRGQRSDNLELAITAYQNGLQVFTRQAFPIDWAKTQVGLGAVYYNQRIQGKPAENLELAIDAYKNALQVLTHEAFPVDWAMTQVDLGVAYHERIQGEKKKNLELAIAAYQAALQVYTYKAFPEKWAITQHNLGIVYGDLILKTQGVENLALAIAAYKNALQVFTREAFLQNHAVTKFALGLAYQYASQPQAAYDALKNAIDTLEFLREEIVSGEESKRKHAEEWIKVYNRMVDVCLELGKIAEAIEYVERSKTRNLVEQILNRDLKTIFPAEVVTQLETYRDEIATGQYQIQNGKAENPKVLVQHLQELRQQRNELQNRYLPIGSGFQFEQFQQNLDNHTVIVEFYITGNKLLTFIFTRQTQQPIVWQSEPKDLDKLLKWGIGYLYAYDNHKTWQLHHPKFPKESPWQRRLTTRLHLLAQVLHIDEIIQQIPRECDRLILIPHQYLHLFPLHGLPINSQQGEETSEILMHRFPAGVSYAPSFQLLQLAQTRKRLDFTHLFAVQNPTGDLTYTNIEVETIKGYFNPVDVLVETAATKAVIDGKPLNTFHCAHFSCHGYFNYEKPLKSALILANSHKPTPGELNPERYLPLSEDEVLDLDNCLTLDAVFALKLEKCRLVTLSACETGLIDFKNISDEYIGLPSGFLVAGTPAVVSSLWTVNDLSTAFLMIKFYENMHHQMSLALALNQAQLWLRDITKEELQEWIDNLPWSLVQKLVIKAQFHELSSTDQPFREPYHWAAFCAIGQ